MTSLEPSASCRQPIQSVHIVTATATTKNDECVGKGAANKKLMSRVEKFKFLSHKFPSSTSKLFPQFSTSHSGDGRKIAG